MKTQRGTTTVEFAVISVALFIVLFGVIEVARALFVWNTVSAATQRGARIATVCPMNDAAIAQVTIFGAPGGDNASPILNGLTTDNVALQYLDEDGVDTAVFTEIAYVRVSIANFQHTLLIPFVGATLNVPAFSTTLPAESLGYVPDNNAFACFPPGV